VAIPRVVINFPTILFLIYITGGIQKRDVIPAAIDKAVRGPTEFFVRSQNVSNLETPDNTSGKLFEIAQ
jgi:hypothetical protein